MAAKRLIPGLFEKLFGGKEALEAINKREMAPIHPFNSPFVNTPAWNHFLTTNVQMASKREREEENAKRLLLPILLSKLGGGKEMEDQQHAKRLLLPLLLSKLGGKEGEDVDAGNGSTPVARDEDILA